MIPSSGLFAPARREHRFSHGLSGSGHSDLIRLVIRRAVVGTPFRQPLHPRGRRLLSGIKERYRWRNRTNDARAGTDTGHAAINLLEAYERVRHIVEPELDQQATELLQ